MKFRALVSFKPGLHRRDAIVANVSAKTAGDAYAKLRERYQVEGVTTPVIVWGVVEVL